MTANRRRSSDQKLDRIDEMIELEEDIKTRGLLVVLRCIGEEVVLASQQISSHSKILSWKSLVAVLMVVQAPIGYVYFSIEDMKLQQVKLEARQVDFSNKQERFDSELKSHVIIFEQYLSAHPPKP